MRYEVFLTEDALRDLEELRDYIAEFDAPSKADHVLDRIEEVLKSLAAAVKNCEDNQCVVSDPAVDRVRETAASARGERRPGPADGSVAMRPLLKRFARLRR